MTDETVVPSYSLNVQYLCECSQVAKDGFVALATELFPYSLANGVQFLSAIWIVPNGDLPNQVRKLAEASDTPGNYIPGGIDPKGIAMPLERDNNLSCHIVIEHSSVELITDTQYYHPFDLVSTLLEELLHVRLYGLRWLKSGFVRDKSFPPCKSDLVPLCSNFHDEFAVSCLKTLIVGSQNLMDHNGELVTGHVTYGQPLAPILNEAYLELSRCVVGGAAGTITIEEAYDGIIREIYRGVFEPLARQAGFRSANSSASHPFNNANDSWFYRTHIEQFWKQVEEKLTSSFSSEFTDSIKTVRDLVEIVDRFLRSIGVATRVTDDNRCWVDLNSKFFDMTRYDALSAQ